METFKHKGGFFLGEEWDRSGFVKTLLAYIPKEVPFTYVATDRWVTVSFKRLQDHAEFLLRLPEYLKERYREWGYKFTEGEPIAAEGTPSSIDKDSEVKKVLSERGKRYGSFEKQADIAQALKYMCVQNPRENSFGMEAHHLEALDMICHKIARIVNGDPNYIDSWLDIAGYATLVVEILKKNEEKGTEERETEIRTYKAEDGSIMFKQREWKGHTFGQ